MLARMDAIRARALLARAPGLSAEHLRALMLAAGGEPARAAERRAAREVQLPPAARGFLSSPDEAALDADLAWLAARSEEHTSELQSRRDLVCRLLLEKKKKTHIHSMYTHA